MKKLIHVSAILFCILFSACKKEKSTNTNCDRTMASIAGTYSIVKIEAGIGGIFQDITHDQLDACELDDKLTLNANGTTVYKDAGVVCDPSGDDTGTWSVSSANKITIDGSTADVSSADIVSFDCSTLVLTATDPVSGVQFRLTMKK